MIQVCATFGSAVHSSEVFCKKGVLRNFTKFSGKHLCLSFFLIKLQASGLRPATLLKMRDSGTGVFFEFCEFLRTSFYIKHL